MDESRLFAKNIVGINFDDIPTSVIEIAKKSLLDGLGVMIGATGLGEGCQTFIKLAVAEGGRPESTIIGSGTKVPSYMAAFANGSLTHALDFEDTYFIHPNAAAIPAALAVAESIGNVDGKAFLTALTLGSDMVCRLSRSLVGKGNPTIEHGWYIPPILNVYGAVTAAAKLMGLDTDQVIDAFSLAMCQVTCSAQLIHSPNSLVRGIRDAFSAKSGVLSAILAREGITGFDEPFEGKAGFFTMYARGNYDRDSLTKDLGKGFLNADVSFKPWPSCAGTHPYVGATLQLVDQHHLSPSDIEEIKFYLLSPNTMLCEPLESKRKPIKAIDAKFSIPFTIGTALVHKKVTLDHFTTEALRDNEVLEVTRKITYEKNPISNDNCAAPKGLVQIKTRQGKLESEKIEFLYGHPNNPISKEALIDKFMDCTAYSARKMPHEDLNRIVELISSLEDVKDVGEIMKYL